VKKIEMLLLMLDTSFHAATITAVETDSQHQQQASQRILFK
jgi:hypothetical protein